MLDSLTIARSTESESKMSDTLTVTLATTKIDGKMIDVVAMIDAYIAVASKSRDDKVRARAVSREVAANFLIVDAAEENLRKFDKAQTTKVVNKERTAKAEAYDAFLEAFAKATTDEERLAVIAKYAK